MDIQLIEGKLFAVPFDSFSRITLEFIKSKLRSHYFYLERIKCKHSNLNDSLGMTKGTGVTVNSIPGLTNFEGTEKLVADVAISLKSKLKMTFFKTIRPGSLIQRFAKVDEVGALADFIGSKLCLAINRARCELKVDYPFSSF